MNVKHVQYEIGVRFSLFRDKMRNRIGNIIFAAEKGWKKMPWNENRKSQNENGC